MPEIARISKLQVFPAHQLFVVLDDGRAVLCDVEDDIGTRSTYKPLRSVSGPFSQAHHDASHICEEWIVEIDLPNDTIYEYDIEFMPARAERNAIMMVHGNWDESS